MNLDNQVQALSGPILILGASGFVGANLLRACLKSRDDAVGTFFSGDPWRLHDIPASNITFLNLQDPQSVSSVLRRLEPKTIFDCSSFGAYSFEDNVERIHLTNYLCFMRLMEEVADLSIDAFVHAGSSSEYGVNAEAPHENAPLQPNSHYAVSKAATSHAIWYFGAVRDVPVVNLRLYSVYGPYEDTSRLIPTLCANSIQGRLPAFAGPEVTRDFVYIDDVVQAFVAAANTMRPEIYGESFNIGTGRKTSLQALAELARSEFEISENPQFLPNVGRAWDVDNWYSNPEKASLTLGWRATTDLRQGLRDTKLWWEQYLEHAEFERLTKTHQETIEKNSVTAIIACYEDAPAIEAIHTRLVSVFKRIGVDYEIIFVNDNSSDNSTEKIRDITSRDPHVIGVTHSRNFGSQAAFRSGMELASKQACVLLDGNLQDPPELIEEFVRKWREGADVVYGRRVKREMPAWLEYCYRTSYWLFAAMSEVPIPRDAGDFSLLDRSVVYWLLQCQERDAFLRGLRAYVGFVQVGVDYVRPERSFGVSTNNWIRHIGWAKKGIFAFSRIPLHALTAVGGVAFLTSACLAVVSIFIRFSSPESVPKGLTFISLLIMCFGSASILGIGLLGEYIGKILEETKARPHFIRCELITRGEIRPALPRKGELRCQPQRLP